MPTLYTYRVLVFLFLILFEVLLTITMFDRVAAASTTMRLFQALNGLGITLYVGYIFYLNNLLEQKISFRRATEQKIKLSRLEFSESANEWRANKEFYSLFKFKKTSPNPINILFPDNKDWQKLIAKNCIILNDQDVFIGTAKHNDLMLRFQGQKFYHQKSKKNIIIILFIDLSKEYVQQNEILNLYKKYRTMSYELDQILNTLPIAIWKREKKGNFSFYNVAYEKLMHHLFPTTSILHENENLFINQFKECVNQKRQINLLKHYIVKNRVEAIKFVESPLRFTQGSVGHAEDVNEMEEFNNNFKLLLAKIEKMMEFSTSGIIIINDEQRISQFNLTFANIFQLDNKWLSEFPTFGMLLDKLRELNKLPETTDYRDYKSIQLKKVNELTTPYYELLHLPNGQTIRFSILPIKSAHTILVFDDITETLKIERLYNELINVHKSMVFNLTQGVIVFSHNGKIKIFNKHALMFLSLESEQLEMLPHFNELSDLIKTPNVKTLRQKIINCIESKRYEFCTIKIKESELEIQLFSLPDLSIQMNISPKLTTNHI